MTKVRKRKVLDVQVNRESDGEITGGVWINFETTQKEREHAFDSMLRAVLTVASHWSLEPRLKDLLAAVTADASPPPSPVAPQPTKGTP